MKKLLLVISLLALSSSFLAIKCNAQTYTNLVSMDLNASPYGLSPVGDLLNVGGNLYGMTQAGGTIAYGVLFSYNIIGNTYTDLENLDNNTAPKGSLPFGDVIDVSGILYGMTSQGGFYGDGLIFSYNIGTSTYTDLYDFDGQANGLNPFGSLLAIGNVLYGMTCRGGTNGAGNIFSYDIGTNTFTNLYSFIQATGEHPYGSLMVDGSILYGMANAGGANNGGVIFSFNPIGNVYTDLVDFDGNINPMGSYPQYGTLTLYNNILYGMVSGGGTDGDGVIFSYNPITTIYTDLYDFSGGAGGEDPYGSLLLSGTTFFGMTDAGGAAGLGNIFSFDISTSTYANLYSFTGGINGEGPNGSLILVGNVLYGMTEIGGVHEYGNIFSFNPACSLSAGATATSNVLCYGASNGMATATVSGGTVPYTYSWSNGSSTVSTSNPTGAILSPGSYTVTVTDNTGSCTASATVTITQPAAALTDGTPTLNSNVLCFGGNGSATAAIPTGGTAPYTYAWNGGATSTNVTNTSLSAGTYTVNVTDAHGCVVNSAGTVTITQPASALADGAPTLNSNVLCFGGNGSATAAIATGGIAPYTYAWNGGATSTNVTNASLSAGTYTVNVTDAHGCVVNSAGTVTITQSASALADGAPTVNSNVLCFGGNGSATAATASGGTAPYTYAWNGGATSTNLTNAALTAGTYTVNVTDAHGCVVNSAGTVTITQPASALADGVPTLNSNVLCFGGNGSATAAAATGGTAPYTYAWNGGATSTNLTNAALSAGTYTVNVTDAHGCVVNSAGTVTITQPAAALADGAPTVNSNVLCFGSNGSATASIPTGGTAPYTYAWNGGVTSTNVTNAALSAGTYTVNVTDAHGCVVNSAGTVTITQPAAALADGAPTVNSNVLCFGSNGSATASIPTGGTAPYTYAWNGGVTSTNVTNAALTAGTYTVNVTDANGCVVNSAGTVTITQPAAALSDGAPTVNSNILCLGDNGSATAATPTGGTAPYTYAWNGGATSTNLTNAALTAGTYTVNVTDANGCMVNSSGTVTITQPVSALADGTPTLNSNVLCFGDNNGSATAATPTGGTAPYTYAWNGGATSTNVTNISLSAGTYTVNVTDAHGCMVNASGTVTITQPSVMLITVSLVNVNSTGSCNGLAAVSISGGTSPYTYAWSPGGGTNDTINGKCKGNYCCIITDAHGCMDSVCVTIANITGIENMSNPSHINIYPNPSTGSFTLTGVSQSQKIEVYNVLGEQVYFNYQITNPDSYRESNYQIDLSSQPNGIYLYRVIANSGELIGEGKMIIQK